MFPVDCFGCSKQSTFILGDEMHRWYIKECMDECPTGWKNFISDLFKNIDIDPKEGASVEIINQVLGLYKANYTDYGRYAHLDFKDEKCYNLFLLKYGGQ